MNHFKPFADDAASLGIGGITIENGRDRLVIYGNVEVTRDKAGLAIAEELKRVIDAAIAELKTGDLPAAIEPDLSPKIVRNPFAP